jgi:RNA polymerase subunit RPABC4/transcription elongation factor Spt4
MNTCRHCGQVIVVAEVKPFLGKPRQVWVHARSGESAAHKCMQCLYVGTESTVFAPCPNCGSPTWSGAWIDHQAEPG